MQQLYINIYFKEQFSGAQFSDFVNGAAFGSLVLIPLQALMFGILIDRLSKKTDLAVPFFVAYKAFWDIITNYMMFGYGKDNF